MAYNVGSLFDDEEQRMQGKYGVGAMFDEEDAATKSRASAVAGIAQQTNPETFAKAKRYGTELGIPAEVAERNLPDVERKVMSKRIEQVFNDAPTLGYSMTGAEFAKLTHDQVPQMVQLEKAIKNEVLRTKGFAEASKLSRALSDMPRESIVDRAIATPSMQELIVDENYGKGWTGGRNNMEVLGGFARQIAAAPFRMSQGGAGVLAAGSEFIFQPWLDLLPGDPGTEISNNLRWLAGDQEGVAKYIEGDQSKKGFVERAIGSGLQSAAQNILPMIASVYTGNPTIALSVMSGITGGQEYQKARNEGLGVNEAFVYATSQAGIEAATEMLPLDSLLKGLRGGDGLLKNILVNQMQEQFGEQTATILQDLNEWAAINKDKPFSEYLKERPEAAAQTAIATLVGSAAQVAVAQSFESAGNYLSSAEEKRMYQEQRANALKQIQEAVRAAQAVAERSPETFAQFVKQAAEDGDAPKEVFINANVLAQAAQAAGVDLAQLLPTSSEQVALAAASDSDVAIPVEEWATNIATQPIGDQLIDHLKTEIGGMTLAESQVAKQQEVENFQKEAEQILQKKAQEEEFVKGAKQVESTINEQLAATGRFTNEANRTYSTFVRDFYVTLANAYGTTPDQMYARLPYKVVSEGQAALNQGSTVEFYNDVPNESWLQDQVDYAKSKGTNEFGVPYMGKTTGYFKGGKVYLPVDLLSKLKGERNEQNNVRKDSLEAIKKIMSETGKLPLNDKGEEYAPYIEVAYDGSAWVSEGNHRIMAAKELGLTHLPVEIRYFDGGERNAGELSPERLLESTNDPNILNQSLSTRVPTSKKISPDLALENVLAIDYQTALADLASFTKNVNALRDLANFPPDANTGNPVEDAEKFIQHVVDNLLWLHDQMPEEWRNRARLWYDGGRKMAEAWADRYGISEMQAAAAIAVLSPQKDWFQNVSSAERVADIVFGMRGFKWDEAMDATAEKILSVGETNLAKLKKQPKPRKKAEKESYLKKVADAEKKVASDRAIMDSLRGKTLGEILNMEPETVARWIRVFDETHNNRSYNILTPEGGASGIATTNSGAAATNAWGNYGAIGKAVSILLDGRAENVFYQIGNEHKVRNFYNNIFDPNSPLGFTTIDTHAVAAALLQPFSGNDDAVTKAFGGKGSAGSAMTGLNGTYPIYLEAYRRAAEQRGILPREMQSITWEAVRGLFEGPKKNALKPQVKAVWESWHRGEIDEKQALQQIHDLAGGITEPSWAGVPFDDNVNRTYQGDAQAAIDQKGNAGKQESKAAHIMFEVAPDPNDAAQVARWDSLTDQQKFEVSRVVASEVVPKVLREFSTTGDFVINVGGYEGKTNPSMSLNISRPELAVQIAKALGFVMRQDSMMVVSETPSKDTEEVGMVQIRLPEGFGLKEIDALHQKLWELKQDGKNLVGGFTVQDNVMIILNYSGVENATLGGIIQQHIGEGFDVDVGEVYSAFPQKEEYDYGTDSTKEGGSATGLESVEARTLNRIRSEASQRVGRASEEVKSGEGLGREEGGVLNQSSQSELATFKAWSNNNTFVDLDESHEFKDGEAVVVKALHGTTADYDVVNLQFANIESDLGGGFYASNSRDDVGNNYAGEGPDLTQKIQLEAERIASETDREYDDPEVIAEAKQKFKSNEGLTMPVFIRFDNPVVLGGNNETFLDYSEPYDEETDEYGEPAGKLIDVIDAIRSVADDFSDIDAEQVVGDIFERVSNNGEGITARELIEVIKSSEGSMYASDNDQGRMAANEFARQVFQYAGYDGFIDQTVNQKFGSERDSGKSMEGMDENTVHYIAFMTKPDQVKSAIGNNGEFDPNNPSILKQETRGGFDPATLTTILNKEADLSTFLHETGHFFLEAYGKLAAEPDAPARIKEDFQALLDWFGVPDAQAWNAMSLDQKRQFHEQFAYNTEIYLFEGRAPNPKLQGIFSRFANWLKRVYKSIRDDLNAIYRQEFGQDLPILTPEIRGVFDRMLASEDQIKQAQLINGMVPLFQSQEESGMTDEEWAAYQEMQVEGTREAIEKHQESSLRVMKWIANAKSRYLKAFFNKAKAARKELRAKVEAEVREEPVYRAMEWLKYGRMKDDQGNPVELTADAVKGAKLNIDAVKAMFPSVESGNALMSLDWKMLGYGKYGMLSEDGMHPDDVAPIFGYPSGEQMIRELVAAEPMKDRIDRITDERMLQEHDDLADPAAVERSVNEALHNDARARFIGVELRALAKAMMPVREMLQAAKQAAYNAISSKTIADIRPKQFIVAEAKAAKAANDASKKGDTTLAIQSKRTQLLNNQLAKESHEALGEVEQAMRLFKTIFGSDKRFEKTRNMDLVYTARAILAQYGFGPESMPAMQYMENIKKYDPVLYEEVSQMLQSHLQARKPYRQMTMDDFRAMRDEVTVLWHMSRRTQQMMIDGQMVDRAQVIEELNQRLNEIGDSKELGKFSGVTEEEKRALSMGGMGSFLRRVESWVDWMDSGNINGVFRKYIWNPVREATDQYRDVKVDYMKRYLELTKLLDGRMTKAMITAPELGYTFGKDYRTNGIAKAEILHLMMHLGNESNAKKAIIGRGWGNLKPDGTVDRTQVMAFLERMEMEGIIGKPEWDYVQGVWDLFEDLKPMAQKAHHDMYGKYFDEITAAPIQTRFGLYRGGYAPALVDSDIVLDGELRADQEALQSQQNSFMFPTTGRGFTMGRVEYNKPLLLNVGFVPSHIDKVLRFSIINPAIRDVGKLVATSNDFRNKLSQVDSSAAQVMLVPWLQRTAQQTAETPATSKPGRLAMRFFAELRTRTGAQIMIGNVSNALQQFTGLFPAGLKAEPKYLVNALAKYTKSPKESADNVAEMSTFMRNAMTSQTYEIAKTIDTILLNPGKMEKARDLAMQHGYFLQTATQNMVNTVTWLAAYEQASEQGLEEKMRIRAADAAVRQTQGTFAPEDLSAFETQNAFVKMFTQFANYFNMLGNLNATEVKKIQRDIGLKQGAGKLFYVYAMGFALPAVMADVIARAFGEGFDADDDEDYDAMDLLYILFGSQARMGMAMVPGVGMVGNAIWNRFNDKPYDDRINVSPVATTLESAANAPFSLYDALVNDKNEKRAVRDVLTLFGLLSGLPVYWIGRPVGFAIDAADGKVEADSVDDWATGLISGRGKRTD